MREIKFRAWDTDKIKFIDCTTHSLGQVCNDFAGLGNRFYYQQYTGLKDKNGKEIFEGDIVNQEKYVSVGVYKQTIGIVKYACFKFYSDCIREWEGSHADLNGNAEVIGNIYENPELLTK